ncbi:MAG TPA: hypothetical protein PKO15_06915 [Fibrobacteria bacterium]|nr:hypothetical protein [Fibrobacteria bacterium]HOX53270.1 hypothetical protein [Fibrobacteria bacterium]
MLKVAGEGPRKRSGQGDHERALREALSGAVANPSLIQRVCRDNRLVLHNFVCPVDQEIECDHPECHRKFLVRLIPGQIVYPRFCSMHRPRHRREPPPDSR